MLSIDFTFLWTAINLVVLYLFLKKFLFGRVGRFMEERSNKIEQDMQEAKRLQTEGEAFVAEQQALLEDARDSRRQIRTEAQEKATREYEEIVAEAKSDAAHIMAEAREETVRTQQRMVSQMRDEVASLAIAAASKVVEADMDSEKNRKLVKDFLDHEGVA